MTLSEESHITPRSHYALWTVLRLPKGLRSAGHDDEDLDGIRRIPDLLRRNAPPENVRPIGMQLSGVPMFTDARLQLHQIGRAHV